MMSSNQRGVYYSISLSVIVVRDGEAAQITNANTGETKNYIGPCAFRPWFSYVEFLQRISCDQQSYLKIKYLNGEIEHRRGPADIFVDPCIHHIVTIEPAITLESAEFVIVYTEHSNEEIRQGTK